MTWTAHSESCARRGSHGERGIFVPVRALSGVPARPIAKDAMQKGGLNNVCTGLTPCLLRKKKL